nr:chemotaxis protein methyltransferase CheR [uncultured bacterium]
MSTTEDTAAPSLQLTRASFAKFATFITRELGIKMSENKVPMLQSRLMRRLRELHLHSLGEYQDYLFNSPNAEAERTHFINAVTTNKTDFFREPQHFDYLTRTALPELARRHGGPNWRFKLWCAGCSSGEEPYTQSIVLAEHARLNPGFDFAILATDISTRVLDHAKQAIYDESRIDPVRSDLRPRYFLRSKNAARGVVRVIPELRRKVSFHQLNFMDEDYRVKDQFEVIFFRNVMIYFDKATQEAVIEKLCRNLVPGGYLFVGHSESLAGLRVPVQPVGTAIFRKPA